MDRRKFFMALVGGAVVTAGLTASKAEAREIRPAAPATPPAAAVTPAQTEISQESPQEMQYYVRRRRRRYVVVRRPRRYVVVRRRPVYYAPRRRVVYRRRYW